MKKAPGFYYGRKRTTEAEGKRDGGDNERAVWPVDVFGECRTDSAESGVISTRVGYSGGDVPNATYRNHGSHAEAIEIIFDPAKDQLWRLLEFFFQIHDPTTKNRQGNAIGTSYRSAIFYESEEQRRTAIDSIADVDASGLWPGKVVTR
jgi:methionine-S-sulfoxide reductase